MSKINLEQYVSPGTLINTKIIKIMKNGVMVKFLKIFVGFIHVDHLENNLDYYAVDAKIEARIIYSCINPPFIYLS
jgi:ribosomal protein S1